MSQGNRDVLDIKDLVMYLDTLKLQVVLRYLCLILATSNKSIVFLGNI